MGRVIPLHPRDHDEVRSLLPWHLSGRLDAEETARIEDHLASCAECRADLVIEQRLKDAVASRPVEVEDGWSRLQARMSRESIVKGPLAGLSAPRASRRRQAMWGGFAIAASVVAVALTLSFSPQTKPAGAYHTLSAAPSTEVANVVVIFRPDTPEHDLRVALQASGARLVGGPTDADAYMLAVPGARRAAVINALRKRRDIVLAEPIDAGAAR